MKVKYKVGRGRTVQEFSGTSCTMSMEEIHRLIDDPNVLQITITRMSAREYLKKAGAMNQ